MRLVFVMQCIQLYCIIQLIVGHYCEITTEDTKLELYSARYKSIKLHALINNLPQPDCTDIIYTTCI